MAGLGTRLYPISSILPKGLMPLVLQDGTLTTPLQLLSEALLHHGIERIGVVVAPEMRSICEQFLSGGGERYAEICLQKPNLKPLYQSLQRLSEHLVFIPQPNPYGLGHAIWCAHSFAEGEAVLVVLADHLFLVSEEGNPIGRFIEAFRTLGANAPLYAVHRIESNSVSLYGIAKGEPIDHLKAVYRLVQLREKPTVDEAIAHLHTPGIPSGQFLAHYGLFAFPSPSWRVQEAIAKAYSSEQGEWRIVDTQLCLLEQMPAYLLALEPPSLDLGTAEGYRNTLMTLLQIRREQLA